MVFGQRRTSIRAPGELASVRAMVTTREVSYPADELIMVGHLARPEGHGPWPTVLLAHDGIGLNDFQRHYADDLAERGYLTLAMEYHGGRWFSNPDEMLARCLPLIADPDRMQAIGRAALEVLLAEPGADPDRLAAVGLGTGGSTALELARAGVAFRALAAVHPGVPANAQPPEWTSVTGTVLLATGSEDPLCTPNQLLSFGRVLQEAQLDWCVNIYGGARHAFWHPPVRRDGALADTGHHEHEELGHAGHHPQHAQRLWNDVIALLAERLLDQ